MREGLTIPHQVGATPLKSLRVSVVSGPDKGRELSVEADTVSVGTAEGNQLVLTDETVSRHHVDLTALDDGVQIEDHGSTNGTRVGSVRIQRAIVSAGTVLTLGKSSLKIEDGTPIEQPLFDGDDLHGLRGQSIMMRRLMAQIEVVGRTDASVVLMGETGTGKEVIARSLHESSRRTDKPFEIVDCGTLMPTLVASELFGHEKGAFTGANQLHRGAFERADGGTIFLDEIGELTPELQTQLLGVLERRSFRRVGGTTPIKVNVRVIAATHRDLRRWINTGEFRQDLYYRLAVARLKVPPLRDRKDDIPLLVEHFLRDLGGDDPLEDFFPSSALETLKTYHWPGNIRELRNFVESTVAFGMAPSLDDHLDDADEPVENGFLSVPFRKLLERKYAEAREIVLRDFQAAYFDYILEKSKGNVSKAAEYARMNRPHLVRLLKRIRAGM